MDNPFGKARICFQIDSQNLKSAIISENPQGDGWVINGQNWQATLEETQDEIYTSNLIHPHLALMVFSNDGHGFCIDKKGNQLALDWF